MNRYTQWTLISAIAVGAFAFCPARVSAADDADKKASADARADSATLPAGVKPREAEDSNDVYKTFEGITEAALTKAGFDDVVERLVDQDRNRIGKDDATKDTAELDGIADSIAKAWKEKYNDDFELEPNDALKSVALLRGEIEDPKAVAAHWPVKPVAPRAGEGDAVEAGAAQQAERNEKGNDDPNLNSNIEKGRDVAIATIPASHGLPALRVSLIREANGWRIDIPNNITGHQLRSNLAKHLTHVKDAAGEWPADKNEAAALVAHHVLMACYNIDAKGE